MMQLKPYPKYKDSGVDWLGNVPDHWDIKPALSTYSAKQIKNIGLKENTVLTLSYGQIKVKPVEKLHGLVPETYDTYQIVQTGDIIIRPTDLQNDKNSLRVGYSEHQGIITSAYLCLKTKGELTSEYGYQLLNVWDLSKAIYAYGSGLRQNLDFVHFKRMGVPLPTIKEQSLIVRYLNYINSRISKYIAAKKKLIKLLEEQKQAIIHLAVTGAIDVRTGKPYPKYKESGIEWLGKIPEMWAVHKLKNIAKMRTSNVDKNSNEYEIPARLCNYVDVYKNERITSDIKFMNATVTNDELNSFQIKLDDVVITKDSEVWTDIGVPSLVEYESSDLVCGYHLAIVRPLRNILIGEYMLRMLQDMTLATQLHVAAKGVTRYGLSQGDIKNTLLLLPSLEEQEYIVKYIADEFGRINNAIVKATKELELIHEYRICLTADVVTGKVDVREAAKDLPEEIEKVIDDLDEEGIYDSKVINDIEE